MSTLLFTQKNIDGLQLAAEVRSAMTLTSDPQVAYVNGQIAVSHPNLSAGNQSAVQTVVTNHTPTTNYGLPQTTIDINALRAKAQAVFNQTDTFTAAQVQRLVAILVLRATE